MVIRLSNIDVKNNYSETIPLLSVVMPVHNPHQYLTICLDSVLQQTFYDYELIAIDDASTDNSYNILMEYAKNDHRLKVLHNEKSIGAASTRNRGLHEASGKYIIFLDADDYFELDYFEQMMLRITSADADVALCPILVRDELDKTEEAKPKDYKKLVEFFKTPFHASDYNNKIFYVMPYAPFNKVIRRDMLIEEKIEFQDLKNSNDLYFGIMSIAVAKSIVYLPKPYIHYRYNTGTQISTNRHKEPMCRCYAFQKIYKELIKRCLWDKFSKMYHDLAVSTVFYAIRESNEYERVMEFIKKNDGDNLGILNLKRDDFLLMSSYARYRILFYGNHAMLGNISDIIFFFIKTFMRGELSVLYCLAGRCVESGIKKFKDNK